MNHEKFFINPNNVEIVETTPDTLVCTVSGRKYYVLESPQEISDLLLEYYIQVNNSRRAAKAKK
jgi:flagellar protein FlbD